MSDALDMLMALLPFGLTPAQVIPYAAAAIAFAVVIAVWRTLIERNPMLGRLDRLQRRRDELTRGLLRPQGHRLRLQTTKAAAMKSLAQRLRLLRSQATAKTTDMLARAGWRGRDTAVFYLLAKLGLPFVFGLAAWLATGVLGLVPLPPIGEVLAPVAGVALGAYAPDVFVRNAIQKREQAIQKGLPDALDLLVICAEAGLSLDAALTRVAEEMGRSCPEIADELGLTAVELGFHPDRRKALENLAKRVATAAVRGIVTTLLQTERYGTPLASSLRVLSAEFRNERMMKAEEKAARLPAILTVPMIVFILPTLMVVLIGPAVLRTMDALKGF
jgi:tight adherence protein C